MWILIPLENLSPDLSWPRVPAKVFHWLNIISLVLWWPAVYIYNANPFFGDEGLAFSKMFLLGGWLAGVDTGTLPPCGYLHSIYFGMAFTFLSLAAGSIGLWVVKTWRRWSKPKRKSAWLAYTAIIPVLLLAVLSGLECTTSSTSLVVDLFGSWRHLFTL